MVAGESTILIVDDEAVNRHVWSFFFREAGFHVLEAGTGEEGLALSRTGPDLIILDVNLPDVSGFEVCRRVKADPATRSVSVVHLSAVFKNSHDRSEGLEGGADAYLVKPVEPRELMATVKALLRIRAAEEAARRAAAEWRATFDAISDAVCLVGRDGLVQRCNKALAALLCRAPADVPGLHLATVLRESAGVEGGLPESGSREVNAGARGFRVSVDPIRDDAGRPAGAVVTLADVTRQRELEEQVRQGQRLEAIGRLAAGIAHDFNNLLTAILGNTALLLRSATPGGPDAQRLTSIDRSAWRAAELTRQLLGFGRKTLLWLRPVDPAELLEDVRRAATDELPPGVILAAKVPPALWAVQADPDQLTQVLRHLLRWGAEAMPGGGDLRLEASDVEVPSAPDGKSGPHVLIRVQDTGEGLAPDAVERVFDPFAGTRPIGEGAGLGLAWVHGIVNQHLGWIECHSERGKGTRFDIYLPRAGDTAAHAPIPATSAASAGVRRVLVAEDNETLRALASVYLRHGGYDPLVAADGAEAVEVFSREGGRIDLVLLDESLPGGEDALRRMRTAQPRLRSLVATASPDEGHGVVRKPYRERELLRAVEAALA